MLHVQSRRRNKRPFSPSLFKSTHFVTIDLCFFWCTVSDGLSLVRGVILSYYKSFVGKKEKKGLEGCSVILVLDHIKREKWESF